MSELSFVPGSPSAATSAKVPTRLAVGTGTRKDMLRRRMLAAADSAAAVAAGMAAAAAGADLPLWTLAFLPAWILVAKICGLYDRDHRRVLHRTIDELPSLLHWATLSVGLTVLALHGLATPGTVLGGEVLVSWTAAFVTASVARALARALWRKTVAPERGLVIGSGPLADALARKLALEAGHHLRLARRLSFDDPPARTGGDASVARAEVWQLRDAIAESQIERVIVAVEDLDEALLSEAVRVCRELGVKLSVAPPLRAMLGTAVELTHVAELPLIAFRTWDASRSTMLLKRVLDLAGATIALVVTAPVFIVAALAIKLDSSGPVLFVQTRAGRHGRPFRMLKFRTMVADAPERLREVVDVDGLTEPAFKVRTDPRVTRVGRFLRRSSLDELPQLLNVLRGQMSLVGPRPEETWVVDRYTEEERFRLELPPGITGPMQVHGRAELSFHERIAVEREYVDSFSLRRDLEIILATVAVVVRGRGAF